jgi:hypothetical protein
MGQDFPQGVLGSLFTAGAVLILPGLALAVTNRNMLKQAAPHE